MALVVVLVEVLCMSPPAVSMFVDERAVSHVHKTTCSGATACVHTKEESKSLFLSSRFVLGHIHRGALKGDLTVVLPVISK